MNFADVMTGLLSGFLPLDSFLFVLGHFVPEKVKLLFHSLVRGDIAAR